MSRFPRPTRLLRGLPPATPARESDPAPGSPDPWTAVLATLELGRLAAALLDPFLVVRATSPALARLLVDEPEPAVVWDGARRLAGRVRAAAAVAARMDAPVALDVGSARGTYRLAGTLLSAGGDAATWTDGRILVLVERLTIPGEREVQALAALLRARHALSPREAEVGGRAAIGESTPAIAAALALSPHTVRHHLERVYARVGVHSRAALAAYVASLARPA